MYLKWDVAQVNEVYQVGCCSCGWDVSGGLLVRLMRCIRWVVGQVDEMYQAGCCSGG
jgi:hypothetical protein